jgi:hypothetical protein
MKTTPGFPKGRTAFLVIHGIGEQNPFETLDNFGRGLHDCLKESDASVFAEHRMQSRPDPGNDPWAEHFVRLRTGKGQDHVDVHEFYWAYLTEKQISVSEIWEWAIDTLKGTKTFYQENKDLAGRYEGKYRFERVARMLCWMRLIFPMVSLLQSVLSYVPFMNNRLVAALGEKIKQRATSILIGYIGDIAIYTTTDEKSRFSAVRRNIQSKALSLLEELLKDGYDRVIVAGHSLGSVIAYDALNKLNIKANLDAGKGLSVDRLKGLVTFGSPLDKIAFFFRERADKKQELRRQMLEHLHSFKTKVFDLDACRIRLHAPLEPYLDHVSWVNYYNTLDPVSGHLDFYRVDENVEMKDLPGPWGVAHIQYWDDRAFFYQDLVKRFL